MATRGRKPKPTAMKELEGNPGKHLDMQTVASRSSGAPLNLLAAQNSIIFSTTRPSRCLQYKRVGWMQRGPIVFQRKIRTTDMRSRARILCGCSIRAVAGTEQDPTGCRVLSIRSRDS